MRHILLLLTACLLLDCSSSDHSKPYLLDGGWTLRQSVYPIGRTETYSDTEETFLRLYDGDSVMYQCRLLKTESGIIVRNLLRCYVTLIDKGGGAYFYLEDDNPYPLTPKGDSTIVIQQNGVLHTWLCADDIANEWGDEIKEIVTSHGGLVHDTAQNHHSVSIIPESYMLSAKERRQASVIHGFLLATVGGGVLLLLIARIAIDNRRAKRRLQLQLQQLQEVQQERPQSVKKAIESVESAFFSSDDYLALQRRLATGQTLKDDDWQRIESQLKKVYPGFSSQLRGLYPMSELEYQVCLLIKLRIAPKDISAVLARDVSTISTVRSRLYKKVFGSKGGAREWDEFILSIGA